jgi:hypothetical protein
MTNLMFAVLLSESHTHGDSTPAAVLLLIGLGISEQS